MRDEYQIDFNAVVVGAGGIGTHLLPMLIRSLMPCDSKYQLNKLVIVDGDIYERRNLSRQQFSQLAVGRNKAQVQVEKIKRILDGAVDTFGLDVRVKAFPHYLTEENMAALLNILGSSENLIIFSGVDNHPCRLLLSEYTERNKELNTLLITGGNNRLDGSVHCQGKWFGNTFDVPVEERHPEIKTDKTDDRAALSCQELHNLAGGEQTIAANAMAAAIMYCWYISIINNPDNTTTIEDIYYDISTMNIRAVRPAPTLEAKKGE